MIYSNACEYAIRALTYLAQHPGQFCLAKEISQSEKIPHYFLSKILQDLARAGLLKSVKGPGGGFQLAKPAAKFTLYEIKKAVDGVADLDECAVGLSRCNDAMPCPLHETFKPLREQMRTYLQTTTLAAMADAVERKRSSRSRERSA
jgi:Rrf2 family iron-sulfur cluster assembly transcriptional regulator